MTGRQRTRRGASRRGAAERGLQRGEVLALHGRVGRARVELVAGTTVLAADDNTLTPPDGTWATSKVVLETGDAPAHQGEPLIIRLLNLNAPRSGIEVNFDDVQLYSEPLP